MTETATKTADGAGSLAGALPTDALKEAAQRLVQALVSKLGDAALSQVEGLTDRLTDVAQNGGVGLTSAFGGGGGGDGEGGSSIMGALSSGAGAVKDKVTGALGSVVPGLGGGGDDEDDESGEGGGGGGGNAGARGKFKFMNIFEVQDVGVPLRLAYDQWTQFADFPSFMKKVENVDQSSDEKITWHAKVFWSKRSWDTTIVEQIPDSHILWTSSGQKGRADGIVTFSELAPNLTRIVLIMEYYPQGFFEKTGNLWRAVGRRARLEFKHFCRHVMMDSLVNRDEIEGWRGEIRDSEVVKTHEEALEEEQAAAQEGEDADEFDEEPADEDLDEDELADDELADDEFDDTEAVDEDLDDEAEDDLADDLADDTDDVGDTEDTDVADDADDEADEDLADDDLDETEDADTADTDEGGRRGRPSRRRARRQPAPA